MAIYDLDIMNSVTKELYPTIAENFKMCIRDRTVTYDYYRSHIKPAPPKLAPAEKATWVCSVCGYVYEGADMPDDFICPLCHHPKSDFKPLT